MLWMDYNITQAGPHFKVEGDWPGEVMGRTKDGKDKGYALYKPGDVFIVNEHGWLMKTDELNALLYKYEDNLKKETHDSGTSGRD
jgi:hypothetical protein